MSNFENYPSREEIAIQLSELRNSGKTTDAIILCQKAAQIYPEDYFYPKIAGDLYFIQDNYDSAASLYLEFLTKIPKPGTVIFKEFVKRYFRLRRILSTEEISLLALEIHKKIKAGQIVSTLRSQCETLIRNELKIQEEISPEGKRLLKLIGNDAKFNEFAKQVKLIDTRDRNELENIFDQFILNRQRQDAYYKIDQYSISFYEKIEQYSKALKIAEELLDLKIDSVTLRTFMRICRKASSFERLDQLLAKYPQIEDNEDFNVDYELVYYYEARNHFEAIAKTLKRMKNKGRESIPIQKTVRNFYLRFGLFDDANRVNDRISELYKTRKGKLERIEQGRFADVIQESEAEVGSKIRELYSEVEHQKQLAGISDLTLGISHELGQPITNIRYTVQFYTRWLEQRKELDKEQVLKIFLSILEETERMGALIKRLTPLTSSRSVIEKYNLVEKIQKRLQAEEIKIRELQVQTVISPRQPVYQVGDPVKFDQLINNLLVNSLDAIREKNSLENNRIMIELEDGNQWINIRFTDTGVGIPAKFRGKIFDPFFSTKSPGKGEGLGLFIVWNLMKMQGGKIRLDPAYTNGARFIISVPKIEHLPEIKK